MTVATAFTPQWNTRRLPGQASLAIPTRGRLLFMCIYLLFIDYWLRRRLHLPLAPHSLLPPIARLLTSRLGRPGNPVSGGISLDGSPALPVTHGQS